MGAVQWSMPASGDSPPGVVGKCVGDSASTENPDYMGVFYEQVTEVKVCFYFFLHWVFAFVVVFGCDACCSPPGFYSHSR